MANIILSHPDCEIIFNFRMSMRNLIFDQIDRLLENKIRQQIRIPIFNRVEVGAQYFIEFEIKDEKRTTLV